MSTYLWSIKSEEQKVNLSWEIMRQAAPYSNISDRCLLCLHEKLAIALYPKPEGLLNKRSEMISKCRRLNKSPSMNFDISLPTNTPRGFHVETTWKRPFPRCFNVQSTWCVCRANAFRFVKSLKVH